MGLLKVATRKRGVAGSISTNLLAIERSIGYLQGGYKDSVLVSKVQLFNTITQIGKIVYDTGYLRNYHPGLSGSYSGFFSINDNVQYNKFDYVTASASVSPISTPHRGGVTSMDFGSYTKGWMLTKPTMNTSAETVNGWYAVNYANDTIANKGQLGGVFGTTRQAFSSKDCSVFTTTTAFYGFNHTTETLTNSIAATAEGYSCGMCRDDATGYQIGSAQAQRITMAGTSLQSVVGVTTFTYQFSESHSVTSNTAGYMMAGYADTTGRYANTQHGLCQKKVFATEAIVTLADLALPQSSGQMMQGF